MFIASRHILEIKAPAGRALPRCGRANICGRGISRSEDSDESEPAPMLLDENEETGKRGAESS